MDADIIVVGAGLAGLTAACEASDAGQRVIVVDQEGRQDLGGQAFWSFGGLFLVNSPEQRRVGIRDSVDLALQDWMGSAAFDRDTDHWGRRWAHAYVQFAAGEKRDWLRAMGHKNFPVVGWAERGSGRTGGHGNTVPRFHITWGTGPGIIAPFVRRAEQHERTGRLRFAFRHRVDALTRAGARVSGIRGVRLAPTHTKRGEASNRDVVDEFSLTAGAVIVATGGIGGDHERVRQQWPDRLGTAPQSMVCGVPAYVDGRMLDIAAGAGARLVNTDRMWHYTEGLKNYDPIWPNHGIRVLPGPSALWLDAHGHRLPAPCYPGFDTLATLKHLRTTGADHSWFILNRRIITKEFGLSGSEQNPDLTGQNWKLVASSRFGDTVPAPVQAFLDKGEDFVTSPTLDGLIDGMQRLGGLPLDTEAIRRTVAERDTEVASGLAKDGQLTAMHAARRYVLDRLSRVVPPHRLTDPDAGPLIAVRLHILSRKSLGGLQTTLDGQCLTDDGEPIAGLYAAGEVSGFGGGGMMGYNALEGTFLGGCLFSGRQAGRAAARCAAHTS